MDKTSGRFLLLFLIATLSACTNLEMAEHKQNNAVQTNSTASPELYREILDMDEILFTAANSQDLTTMRTLFTQDLEWFQDNDEPGFYDDTMASFADIFSREHKPTRTLIPNTSEVYPIKNFGAVQLGKHQFCIEENGQESCGIFGFVHLWQDTNNGWKIAKVISYGH